MKFSIAILVGILACLTFVAQAQNENKECERLKLLAKEAILIDEYKTAVTCLLKAETSCDGLDQEYWERLLGCLKTIIHEEDHGSQLRAQYIDAILRAWERQELAGLYDEDYDLERATFLMQLVEPDHEKADLLFQRGIKAKGLSTHESYLVYAYYATYTLYESAEGDKKSKFKQRMLSDFLKYSELADSTRMSEITTATLRSYFDYTFLSCEELLPEVDIYVQSLPKDTTEAIQAIHRLMKKVEDKHCSQSIEYVTLVDAWLQLDSTSFEAIYRKCLATNRQNPTKCLPKLMEATDDPELKTKIQYQIAYTQYKAGQYQAAYTSGLACTGEYKSKGLLIAAQSVAAVANSCGDSTFDRKCNFIYAAQLAEQAGQGGTASGYRAKGPPVDCRYENNSKLAFLSCWGVTINLCP